MRSFVLLLLSLLLVHPSAAQTTAPLFETRAVWFATVLRDGGWPAVGSTAAEQEAALRDRIRRAHALGINTFIFQTSARGDAFYPSDRLPWSPNPKGAGQDPGYDPLTVALDEAHSLGMEVHAWINVFRVGDTSTPGKFQGVTDPAHVIFAHPEWVIEDVHGSSVDYWLDPSNEEARAWQVANVMELVRTYDLDAVHFDFIRYPQGGLEGDGDKFQADPDNGSYDSIGDWRRDNVTQFVRDVHAAIMAEKPWMKIGSAPLGNYQDNGLWSALWAYSGVYQASRQWLAEGIHDYLAPQIYWDIGSADGSPDFEWLAKDWVDESSGRPIFTGMGVSRPEVQEEVDREIDVSRAAGAAGQSFFRYDHMMDVAAQILTRYDDFALPAPMTHRFGIAAPTTPAGLQIASGSRAEATLTWAASDGTATDPLRGYAVFRHAGGAPDVSRAEDLFAVVPASQTQFSETFSSEPGVPVYYQVVALSRLGATSDPSGVVSTEGLALSTEPSDLPGVFRLNAVYPNPIRGEVTITYKISRPMDAMLTVYDAAGRRVATVAEGPHDVGSYRVGVEAALASGVYLCELRTEGARVVRQFVIAR